MVTETLFRSTASAEDYLEIPEDGAGGGHQADGILQPEGEVDPRGLQADRRDVRRGGASTMEELIDAPGVARKTANIVLGNAYGKVGGHRRRHARGAARKRLGFTRQQDPDKIEQDLMRLVPEDALVRFQLRDDRSRPGDLPGEEAALHRVSGRATCARRARRELHGRLEHARPRWPSRRRLRRTPGAPPRRGRPTRRRPGKVASDHSRQSARTEQPRQTVLASATWAERVLGGANREEQLGIPADSAGLWQPPHLVRIVSESPFSHMAPSPADIAEPSTWGRR